MIIDKEMGIIRSREGRENSSTPAEVVGKLAPIQAWWGEVVQQPQLHPADRQDGDLVVLRGCESVDLEIMMKDAPVPSRGVGMGLQKRDPIRAFLNQVEIDGESLADSEEVPGERVVGHGWLVLSGLIQAEASAPFDWRPLRDTDEGDHFGV